MNSLHYGREVSKIKYLLNYTEMNQNCISEYKKKSTDLKIQKCKDFSFETIYRMVIYFIIICIHLKSIYCLNKNFQKIVFWLKYMNFEKNLWVLALN